MICDFLVVTRITGRTVVREFTEHETTELLTFVVECITGVQRGFTGVHKAVYVDIYTVSYEGELKKLLSWYNEERMKEA